MSLNGRFHPWQGVHRTRISLLCRCPVMAGESEGAPNSRYHGYPAVSLAVGPAFCMIPEIRLCVRVARQRESLVVLIFDSLREGCDDGVPNGML